MISEATYQDMVANLKKAGELILETMTPDAADLLHMAVGVSGESGELLDAVKKHVIYNKPLDRENIIEELGDLEFYMEGVRQRAGVTRQETLDHNFAKLGHRYSGHRYSDEQAQLRKDKAEANG